MPFRLLSYRGTRNLGDAIQTVAVERLLGVPRDYAERDAVSGPGAPVLVNGWLGADWQAGGDDAVYAGVHLAGAEALERLVGRRPARVGARDPVTQAALAGRGIAAEMIGCATLTLPPFTGPRAGVLAVDFPLREAPAGAVPFSHWIAPETPWAEQRRLAREALARYAGAEAVFTRRLHVILPCLALGTPVWVPRTEDARFGVLAGLGLAGEALAVAEVGELAGRYADFLRCSVGLSSPQSPPPGGWGRPNC